MRISDEDRERCRWIDLDSLGAIPEGKPLILFGAGQGSVEFLEFIRSASAPFRVRAITDNDPTQWGKELLGITVIAPQSLGDHPGCVIVITTISGREAVSAQLQGMGYAAGSDFVAIGRYPSASVDNLKLFLSWNERLSLIKPPARVLHVGPGGFLGLECCLRSLGYGVVSMDAHGFGIRYPDVTGREAQYRDDFNRMLQFLPPAADAAGAERCFAALFEAEAGATRLDSGEIPYSYPHRFSSIPLEDASVDAVLSFAVLEHVRNPEKVVREISRVLRPGGVAFQKIVTRDHRSFGRTAGYNPFSYLFHSEAEWEEINRNKFFQNRLLPHEWEALFARSFDVTHMETLDDYPLDDGLFAAISERRPDLERRHLERVNCLLVARKP